MKRGKFITFEGGEGSGKSTQAKLLYDYLIDKNISTILTREPGGLPEGEAIRGILKNSDFKLTNYAQINLFSASRNMFVSRIVKPNLEKGINVISDRFADSTRAYQGYGGRGNLEQIEKIISESTEGVSPDLTFIIDIDPRIGLSKEVEYSSFSKESLDYHQRVREGYLKIARKNPKRYVVIPYLDGEIDEMQRSILSEILRRFDHNHGSDNLN